MEDIRQIPSIYEEQLNKLRDHDWDDNAKTVVQRLPRPQDCNHFIETTRTPKHLFAVQPFFHLYPRGHMVPDFRRLGNGRHPTLHTAIHRLCDRAVG